MSFPIRKITMHASVSLIYFFVGLSFSLHTIGINSKRKKKKTKFKMKLFSIMIVTEHVVNEIQRGDYRWDNGFHSVICCLFFAFYFIPCLARTTHIGRSVWVCICGGTNRDRVVECVCASNRMFCLHRNVSTCSWNRLSWAAVRFGCDCCWSVLASGGHVQCWFYFFLSLFFFFCSVRLLFLIFFSSIFAHCFLHIHHIFV